MRDGDMRQINDYINGLQLTLNNLPQDQIAQVIDVLYKARLSNKQIFILGNGGSASTASHFVCDLSKNTRKDGWPNFRVIGLTDNMAILSAYANDEGYENVFSMQLASFVQPGDVVIAISTSGNSLNVLNAIQLANRVNATTVGFTGFDGGRLSKLVDIEVHVPSNMIEHVEDIHLMLEHLVCKALKEMFETTSIILESGTYLPHEVETIELNTDRSKGVPIITTDFRRMERNQSTMDLLQRIERELDTMSDSADLLQQILHLTLEGIGATSGSIVVLDKNGIPIDGALAYKGTSHMHAPQQFSDLAQHGLIAWVAQNRRAALVEDTSDDPRWLQRSWESSNKAARSAISVPLTARDQVIGVMTLVSSNSRQFTLEDMALLTMIAVNVSLRKVNLLNVLRE
jgi:D-sedoheptulose 7-phosphate isomerase